MVSRPSRAFLFLALVATAVRVLIYLLNIPGGPSLAQSPALNQSRSSSLVQTSSHGKPEIAPMVQNKKEKEKKKVQSPAPPNPGDAPLVQKNKKNKKNKKQENKNKKNTLSAPPNFRGFLVDSPACKIPDLDPMDPSIARWVKVTKSVHCKGGSVTYVEGTMLRINRTYIQKVLLGDFGYCCYKAIIRRPNSDYGFGFSGMSDKFDSDIKVGDEFIQTYCYDTSGKRRTMAFHFLVHPQDALERRCSKGLKQHVEKAAPKEILNVQMVGVESLSRLNAMRQMPKTRDFLLNELGALEMTGYTKVGDNTFPNVLAILTGRFQEELPWERSMKGKPFDDYDFIWNNFSRAGYRTLYAEDSPELANFNSGKVGFHTAPCDYYTRGVSLGMEHVTGAWTEGHRCVYNVMETDLYLRYASDFSRQFNASSQPHFAYTFICRLSHHDPNGAGAGDVSHLNFIKRLQSQGSLHRTVLLYFGDHGSRHGPMRKTYVGRAEERLPALFLVLPKWFPSRYPHLYRNMQVNTKRLTTPFDVHETLNDILRFDGRDRPHASVTERGISLFREIPESRTCQHAHIKPHYCMCTNGTRLPLDSDIVVNAARELVKIVNDLLGNVAQRCERLSVKTVRHAEHISMTMPFGDRARSGGIYQVTLQTTPGDALLEGTLTYGNGSFALAGDVSRINAYGTQSACVDDARQKKFCFCKAQSQNTTSARSDANAFVWCILLLLQRSLLLVAVLIL